MTEQTLGIDSRARMRTEVWVELNRTPKELSPKWFYDAAGSALFDEITRLDEYYPTRTEREILEEYGRAWFARLHPRALVELGAGSAEKTRILLDAMHSPGAVYVPVDISESYLEALAEELQREYPDLTMIPARSDIAHGLEIPQDLPAPTVLAFLGSTIGNFDRHAAVRLLGRVRAAMRVSDRFLMGADLIKDVGVLERAYNDAAGVTAEFNRNILRVLNREIDTDFDPAAFEHRAFYNADARRIEMHLVALSDQSVTVPLRGVVQIKASESIRTEISCKYDRQTVKALFDEAGLEIEHWFTDPRAWFALVAGRIRT
jgi:L-histidine N-alpha-methyltransferase